MTSRSSVAREPRFCHGQADVRVPWVATAARKVTPLTSCHSPVACPCVVMLCAALPPHLRVLDVSLNALTGT